MENESTVRNSAPRNSTRRTGRLRFPSRLLFESLLIILSVALGFVVAQWRERAAELELAARVLHDVVVEIEDNLAAVEGQIARHEAIIERLAEVDVSDPEQSGLDLIFRQVGGDLSGRPLRQAAWDAAVSSGALRLIDYNIAAALSEIYVAQENVYTQFLHQTTSAIYIPDTFNPARRREVVQMFRWLMQEAAGRERFVRDLYLEHLPNLRDAAT